MTKSINDCVTLNNGAKMPYFGLGLFQVEDEVVTKTIIDAIDVGYRAFDTAAIYGNEKGSGIGFKDGAVPREELFITSKLWNTYHGYDSTLKAFEKTMSDLQLEYLDLYLIHWPLPKNKKYVDSWKAMEKLYREGQIRAIGLSNFEPAWIQDILDECEVVPAVNQVECSPYIQQMELHEYCKSNNIRLQSWTPLAQGRVFEDSVLIEIAEKYKKTIAQVVLRWLLQRDIIVIPKTINKERMISNAEVFDFEIEEQDMEMIKTLNDNTRCGPNPYDFHLT